MKIKLFFLITIIVPLWGFHYETKFLNNENGNSITEISAHDSLNQMPRVDTVIPPFEPGFWASLQDKYNDLKLWLGFKTLRDIRWNNTIVNFSNSERKISDSLCTLIQGARYTPIIEIKDNGEKRTIVLNPQHIQENMRQEIANKRKLYTSLMGGWTVPGDGLGKLYIKAIADLKQDNCDLSYYINSIATDDQRKYLLIKFDPVFYNEDHKWCLRVYKDSDCMTPLPLLCALYKIKTEETILFEEPVLTHRKKKSIK